MLTFLFFLSFFQGLSTYLMSISISHIKNSCKPIDKIIKEISPYKLLEYYTPDQMIDGITLSIISRCLLFSTGCIGILICLIIHDIYYKLNKYYMNKKTLSWKDTNIELSNYITTDQPILNDYVNINLIIDSSISSHINSDTIIDYLSINNITCKSISFLNITNNVSTDITPLCLWLGRFNNINSNNIDDAIFKFNLENRDLSIYQTICICWDNELYNNSIFKHLCIPIKDISNDSQKYIGDKIIKLVE